MYEGKRLPCNLWYYSVLCLEGLHKIGKELESVQPVSVSKQNDMQIRSFNHCMIFCQCVSSL